MTRHDLEKMRQHRDDLQRQLNADPRGKFAHDNRQLIAGYNRLLAQYLPKHN